MSAVAGLFLALSTIAIILRCYCRAVIVKAFGADDWFAVIAWVIEATIDCLVRVEMLTINARYFSSSFADLPSLACTTELGNMLQCSQKKIFQWG